MTKKNPLQKPHNSYNLFFILERAMMGGERGESGPHPTAKDAGLTGYEDFVVPPLPPRYKPIEQSLPRNWFAPGRNLVTKRKHVKKDGALSFSLLSKTIGHSWKEIDKVTKGYVEGVSRILKE